MGSPTRFCESVLSNSLFVNEPINNNSLVLLHHRLVSDISARHIICYICAIIGYVVSVNYKLAKFNDSNCSSCDHLEKNIGYYKQYFGIVFWIELSNFDKKNLTPLYWP